MRRIPGGKQWEATPAGGGAMATSSEPKALEKLVFVEQQSGPGIAGERCIATGSEPKALEKLVFVEQKSGPGIAGEWVIATGSGPKAMEKLVFVEQKPYANTQSRSGEWGRKPNLKSQVRTPLW